MKILKKKCCERMGFNNWIDIRLSTIDGYLPYWKSCKRGLYFFFDLNEHRKNSDELRVVRIGTQDIKAIRGKSTLWKRLRQHKGDIKYGGGNHRGSIFRLLVGESMINRSGLDFPTWGVKNNAPKHVRLYERSLETKVSDFIRNLPFVVLKVDPNPDPENHRKFLEENSIALLSNINREIADEPSMNWLGRFSSRSEVTHSGLWNVQHVKGKYNGDFLNIFDKYVKKM